MKVCGPKLSLCGLVLSVWGIIQLVSGYWLMFVIFIIGARDHDKNCIFRP